MYVIATSLTYAKSLVGTSCSILPLFPDSTFLNRKIDEELEQVVEVRRFGFPSASQVLEDWCLTVVCLPRMCSPLSVSFVPVGCTLRVYFV